MATKPTNMLDALDPSASIVVEACAGSGKTWLLVSRIVRLLMAGVAPNEILAITFTRKGAREMQERLNTWLEELAVHPDDEHVKTFLRERGMPDDTATVSRARGLFETVLTAQPGIKINTFHGWFADIVQRAPLQAGLAKGFTLTESVHALEQEAWQRYAQSLATGDANPQQSALDELFREIGLHNTRKLLAGFLSKRAEWWRFSAGQHDPVAFAVEQLLRTSDVNVEIDYFAQLFRDQPFDEALTSLVAALESGGKTEQKVVSSFEIAGEIVDPSERFAAMKPLIFTKDGDVRDARLKFCTKIGTSATDALVIVSEKMRAAEQFAMEQRVVRINRYAFVAGQGLLDHYQALKAERGLLDFTDIEYAVYSLLQHSEYAEYMQYKLDARYRHVLLDEFQDTNPLQWMTLQAWLQASSDVGLRPTVFLVGDPKQSIFYFRRADARLFGHATEFLRREYGAKVLQQNVSRRSAPAVLDAVNSVFAEAKHLSGFAPHQSFNGKLKGDVFVLPLSGPQEKEVEPLLVLPGLRDLLSTPKESETETRRAVEAEALAQGLRAIVGSWTIGDEQRLAEYRDVMILTRGRTQLREYESALRRACIPYTSARKGGLLDSLEARDLLALLQFLLRPGDNLNLAHSLRAPYFACLDEDLIALAKMEGDSWWQRLNTDGQELSTPLARARACPEHWLQLSPTLPVHDLLDRIFHEADVEARYACAVPPLMTKSVHANLTAFMELSLTLDSGRYPSLARFLADLNALRQAPDIEAPDEGALGETGDAVRILTVHGAKGLEAPIVWLIDATAKRKPREGYDVLVTWPTGAEQPSHFSFLTTKADQGKSREKFLAEEQSIREQEEANLLYVAMTRAKQYLIVSGNQVGSGAGSWYEALSQSMPVREIISGVSESPRSIDLSHDDGDPTFAEDEPLPVFSHGIRKRLVVDNNRDYGIRLHSLLEAASNGEISNATAERLLANDDNPTRESLMRHAQSILRAPHLQQFFDAGKFKVAHNEVDIVDANGDLLRLDRLVEFESEVWVLDYKSATSQTAQTSALLDKYRAQLERYRDALREIYPGKQIRCGLIFGDAVLQELL